MGAADLLANLGESRGQVLSAVRDLQGKLQHLSPAQCFVYLRFGSHLKKRLILVVFFFLTSILCLVIQKPGVEDGIPLLPAGGMPKCTFAGSHEPALPAPVPRC